MSADATNPLLWAIAAAKAALRHVAELSGATAAARTALAATMAEGPLAEVLLAEVGPEEGPEEGPEAERLEDEGPQAEGPDADMLLEVEEGLEAEEGLPCVV